MLPGRNGYATADVDGTRPAWLDGSVDRPVFQKKNIMNFENVIFYILKLSDSLLFLILAPGGFPLLFRMRFSECYASTRAISEVEG